MKKQKKKKMKALTNQLTLMSHLTDDKLGEMILLCHRGACFRVLLDKMNSVSILDPHNLETHKIPWNKNHKVVVMTVFFLNWEILVGLPVQVGQLNQLEMLISILCFDS